MANKQRGYVEIELDKVRQIRFDLNALVEVEEALGVTFDKLQEAAAKGGMKVMRKVLWIGLKQEDADLTEHQVGAMIDASNVGKVSEAISEAFGAATGATDGGQGNARAGAGGPGRKPRN